MEGPVESPTEKASPPGKKPREIKGGPPATPSGDGVRSALQRAGSALERRDGKGCLAALDEAKADVPGSAVLRGQCEMLRGRCDEGKRLLSVWYAEAKAREGGSPAERARQVEILVADYAHRLCPAESFASLLDRFAAIHRQAREAGKRVDVGACRRLDGELSRLLPRADLEAAHRKCQAHEAGIAPRVKAALLEHRDLPETPRPLECEEPRRTVALALKALGTCLVAGDECGGGTKRLLLAELVAHRDQAGSVDMALAADHVGRTAGNPACAAALQELRTDANEAQKLIDALAKPGRTEGKHGLEQRLESHGVSLVCGDQADGCRLVPILNGRS
jgi:hypothetical protein